MRERVQLTRVVQQIAVSLTLYLVVLGINYALDPQHMGWVNLKLHPYGIIVLVSALRFGRIVGLMSGLVGAVLLISFRFAAEGIPDYFEDVLTWEVLDLPAVLCGMGFFLGDVRLQLAREIDQLKQEVEILKDQRGSLRESIHQLEDANLALRERAYGELSPASKLYKTARALDVLDRNEVCAAAMNLVVDHLKARRATLWLGTSGEGVTVRAEHGWDDMPAEKAGAGPTRDRVLEIVLEQGQSVSLRDRAGWGEAGFRHGTDILMATPIRAPESGEIGALTIEDMPFLQLTEASEQALDMIGEWTAMSLERVHLYDRLKRAAIYDEELGVLSEEHFFSSLRREFERSRRLEQLFLVFRIELVDFFTLAEDQAFYAWKIAGQALMKTLRGTDLVSRHGDPGKLWVMCTGPGMDGEFMADRLKRAIGDLLDLGPDGYRLEISYIVAPDEFSSVEDILTSFELAEESSQNPVRTSESPDS